MSVLWVRFEGNCESGIEHWNFNSSWALFSMHAFGFHGSVWWIAYLKKIWEQSNNKNKGWIYGSGTRVHSQFNCQFNYFHATFEKKITGHLWTPVMEFWVVSGQAGLVHWSGKLMGSWWGGLLHCPTQVTEPKRVCNCVEVTFAPKSLWPVEGQGTH